MLKAMQTKWMPAKNEFVESFAWMPKKGSFTITMPKVAKIQYAEPQMTLAQFAPFFITLK